MSLTPDEQREAALLAVNMARSPEAVEQVAAELVMLRSVCRMARRLRYLSNNQSVRALLDRLPRRL